LANWEDPNVTSLDADSGYLVLINTFAVQPDRAEELLAALSHATAHGMRQRPGFVSANLHMSHDRRHVANYVQWRSKADLDAMMADPAAQEHMRQIAATALSFEPIYYELRESHAAEGSI
jgi:quinol monooxygenase YgiN